MHGLEHALLEVRDGFAAGEHSAPRSADELTLATELLSVTDEAELDRFLGRLIEDAGRAARSPVGRALGGLLKSVVRKALPLVGNVVAPGIGGAIGAGIASAWKRADQRHAAHERPEPSPAVHAPANAAEIFGMELEGLSAEDRAFEVARQFVRLAVDATERLDESADADAAPACAVGALREAAAAHAPGLLLVHTASSGTPPASEEWIRRGRTVVVVGG